MATKKTWKIKLIESFTRHWIKYVIFGIIAGISITGFQCEWGKIKFKKDPVIEWKRGKTNNSGGTENGIIGQNKRFH